MKDLTPSFVRFLCSGFGEVPPTTAKNRFADLTSNPNPGTTAIPDVAFNLRYPGQYADKESGLFYNYFRTYQPGTGRYVQPDPIGLEGGDNRFEYVGSNPLIFADTLGLSPDGPSFLTLTTFASARRNTTLDDATRAGAWTRAVTLPLIAGAASPSAIGLVGSAATPACSAAAKWYMMGAEADAAWLDLSLKEKLLYEVGQKTTASYARYSSLDPVARGAGIVRDLGWLGALAPEAGGVGLGIGSTFSTGPTPLFRWLLPRLLGGAGVGSALSNDAGQCDCGR